MSRIEASKLLSYLSLILLVGIFPAFGVEKLEPQPVSLSCRDADIVDVLRAIALQSGVNIVPDNSVSGTVTIQLSNAPFEAGLKTLLETNGFTYENQDGIYRIYKQVTTPDTLQINVSDGRISIDARGADVKEVIRQLSTQASINIVADSALSGTITAHLSDIAIEDALEALFVANNYTLYQDANIYRVGSRTSIQKGSFAIFARQGSVTIDVKNAPAVDILQELAAQTRINLVIVGNISGNLTMRLEGVTLETALDMVTAASGAAYKKMDSIYVVGDATVKPGMENPLLEQKVIWLEHIEAEDILSYLPADIPKTNVTLSQNMNALVVRGAPQTIERIEALLSELDVSTPEIRSRQQWSIWVDVDAEGFISVDFKDAPMEMVVRELSIKTGINVALIDTSASSSLAVTQRRATAETTQAAPVRQTSQRRQTSQPGRIRTSRSLSGLSGNVNVRIEKATLEEVLDTLFMGTEYTYKLSPSGEKQIYIIGSGNLMMGQVNPLNISRKIDLNYLDVTKVMELLPATISDANITLIPDQNAITVLGTEEMIEFLHSYLEQIDTPTPQVMIEAILLEITQGNTKELGLEFSASKERTSLDVASGIGLVFDSLSDVPEGFDLSLKALLSENKARILASPRVAVLSGQTAFIDVGVKYMFQTTIYGGYGFPYETYYQPTTRQTIESRSTREIETRVPSPYQSYSPYQSSSQYGFNTIDTGISLDITPWIGNAGEITMTIVPKIRDADSVTSEEARVAERSIDTVIRVKDGGMIIIGGLLQEKELTKEDKTPILGSIPLIGRLFSQSNKVENESELIIVIKPRIITSIEETQDAQKR